MASFTTLFLDQFRLMTSQSFNQKNGIWHPQEYAKTHTIKLEAYSKGHVPKEFFTRCHTPSKAVAPFAFALKEGLRPSDAIDSIGKKPAILDSGCAYMLVFYRALFSYLGEEKFNALYQRDRFILRAHPYDTITAIFFKKVVIQDRFNVQPGDQCCFKNLLSYSFKHGLPEDEYVVCNSDYNFMGLGLQGTQRDVEEALLRKLNEPTRVVDGGSLSRITMTYEEFINKQTKPPSRNEGRLFLEVLRPDTERIQQMAETPLDELDDLLESWCHSYKRYRPDSPTL